MEPGTQQQSPEKSPSIAAAPSESWLSTQFSNTLRATWLKGGGRHPNRSMCHPDRVRALRQNTLFTSCPPAHPLLLTPTANVHFGSFSKKSRLLNSNHLKVIHNSHNNCKVTMPALESSFILLLLVKELGGSRWTSKRELWIQVSGCPERKALGDQA